ncbi:transcriptional repressor NrdR [Candidatus Woesebacteria bacterium]|nr:transcriptional repressor NrdR [Candidatus Woesebacteria bacterium]
MKCIYCKNPDSDVIETRVSEDGMTVRRRRACTKCEKRFTTYERIEDVPIFVIKRDKRREQFDAAKLKSGIMKAVGKTQVTFEQIDSITSMVTSKLIGSGSNEVFSRKIGEMVAEQLKKIDKVAYIRFASVFKRFEDPEQFVRELKRL